MAETKTLPQVAEELDIPANTVKTWLHQLDVIPAEKDGAGRWRFGPEAEAVLRQIQALRLDGRSLNTVRQRLGERSAPAEPEASAVGTTPETPAVEPDERRSALDESAMRLAIRDAVAEAIQEQAGLAEKYARATYEVGELRATVKARDERLEVVAAELAQVKAERDQARALLAAPPPMPARPWWKVWG